MLSFVPNYVAYHPVIDIVIATDLPGVISIHFNNFRKVIVHGIKLQLMFAAPFDSFIECFAGTACPEDKLVAFGFPLLEIFYEWCVQNQDDLITLYVTDRFVDASCEADDCEAIANTLLTLGVKFLDIDRQVESEGLRKAIYVRDLYVLNRNNVESILKNEYGFSVDGIRNKELTAVYSDNEQALTNYVDENISEFISSIVIENSEIQDDLKIAVEVLNNAIISRELKEQYINLMSEKFESLESIEETQWQLVLMHNKVICNFDEIIRYFNRFGLAHELIEFINISNVNIDYTKCEDVGVLKKFFDTAVKNKDIIDDRYKEIVEQIGTQMVSFNIVGLGDAKLTILIKENMIPMNLSNLQFIRQNYHNEICIFVEKDIDGYISLIQGNNLIPSELLMLISDQNIDIDSRKKCQIKFLL